MGVAAASHGSDDVEADPAASDQNRRVALRLAPDRSGCHTLRKGKVTNRFTIAIRQAGGSA
jgi:hypothetical protein